MSRKLATTIKDSAIPGKYKRVLEAYAAFANNDGTNIFASQAKLAAKAGAKSVDTIQRNTPDLIESGILRRGETHTCKVKDCHKGSTHFAGFHGKWTNVYEINISNLQNAVKYLATICGKHDAAKCRKHGAAICGTTQALKETPAPCATTLGITQTPPQSPLVESEQDSKSPSAPNSPPSSTEEKPNPLGSSVPSKERATPKPNPKPASIEDEDLVDAMASLEGNLLASIMPTLSDAAIRTGLPACRRIIASFTDVDDHHRYYAAECVLAFNRLHRSHKYATKDDKALLIRTPQQYLKALDSESCALLNDYNTHDFDTCEICTKGYMHHYTVGIERMEKKRLHEEAAAASKVEAERLSKLCVICQKYPFGLMTVEGMKDYLNRPTTVKLCDGCYDRQYEYLLRGIGGTRGKLLDMRPGYKDRKFDTTHADNVEIKALAEYFKDNAKVGDWKLSFNKRREALGVDYIHLSGVLRYVKAQGTPVTEEEFIGLLLECERELPLAVGMSA
jgi:hypothetical protein